MSQLVAEILSIIEDKHCSLIDAVLMYGEEHKIDEESMGNLIKKDPILLDKIREEALVSNLLKDKRPTNLESFFD